MSELVKSAGPAEPQAAVLSASAEISQAATAGLKAGGSITTASDQQRRELIRALSRGRSLPTLVADPTQFDLRQACRVAKIALEEDPEFDSKLVELIKSGVASSEEQIVRILGVLESVCSESHLLSHILSLKNMQGRVRSKVTLMVSRLTRDPQWLRQQLEDDNPRIRANAIEGIWDVQADGLEHLLRSALKDSHHRVAANAALALHKIGDPQAVKCLFDMLRSSDPMFVRAALWAVGQSRDPRFLPAVETLARGLSGEALLAATNVVAELRSSRASAEFIGALSLDILQDSFLPSGERCVRLCCVADSTSGWLGQRDVNAVSFLIYESESQVEEYRLQWVNDTNPFIALIVQPRAWNGCGELFKPALRHPTIREIYGFLPYQTRYSSVRGKENDEVSEVKFENYLEMSKEYLGRTYQVAKDFDTALSIGLATIKNQSGRRHLFVLADPSVGDAGALVAPEDLGDTQIHCAVWDHASPALQASCKALAARSGGRFAIVPTAREFMRMLISVRSAHFGNFELVWKPRVAGVKAPLRISCHTNFGNGEISAI